MMSSYGFALLGGALLGLSAALLLLLNGRIAGISGMLGRSLAGQGGPSVGFLLGLLAGLPLHHALTGATPVLTVAASWPAVVAAGLLVGVGTRMGSGCTSGHGILGLARLSRRSLVATLCFLAAGVATATVIGLLS
ncbi:putative membrane protein YedE/YeeE [Bosea sp. OAE506]|uniref:YeeE/YedE family protein n=1 Tax=Bosea sp. OAE506 TaxID=2663870 RepID=UPI00178A6769